MNNQIQRRGRGVLFLCALTIFLLAGGMGFPQTTEATLDGTVSDEESSVLSNAAVILKNMETGYVLSTVSRGDGRYLISAIPPGRYEIEVSLSGFATQKRQGLTFNVSARLTIDFQLSAAAVQEEVVVTAEAPMVEMTKSDISSVVDRYKIDDLPFLDRDFSSLTLLKAGIQGDRASGATFLYGEMIVDGIGNEAMHRGEERTGIPADAIQEFRVITNQFQAEYGRAAGLLKSVITRSGTNDWTGRVSGFYRDEALDTVNYFVNHAEYKGTEVPKDQWEKPPYSYYRFGGYLGGPITKDKAHLFIAYDGKRLTSNSTITSPLVLKETVPVKDDQDQVFLKLTYQANEKNLFSFRYNFHNPRGENQSIGGLRTKERAQNPNRTVNELQANWTFFLSGNTVNEVRLLYSNYVNELGSPNPDAFSIVRPSGYFGTDSIVPSHQNERTFQIVDNLSLFLSNHHLKFGFDYMYVKSDFSHMAYQPGEFQFLTDKPFNAADPSTYPFLFIGTTGDPNQLFPATIAALFVQDTWKVHSRLTLNLGLRFNYFDLYAQNNDIWNIRHLNPRFGFSWDPVGDGKTSIRGGIGTYSTNTNSGVGGAAVLYNQLKVGVILFPNYPNPHQPNPFFPTVQVPMTIATYRVQDNFVQPYTLQTSLGFKREFITDLSLGADLVWARGYSMLRNENLNPIIPGTSVIRKDPTRGDEWVIMNNGRTDFKALYLTLEKRYSQGWALEVSYTLSKSMAEDGDGGGYTGSRVDSYEADGWERMWGPISYDARHRLAVNGIVDLPLGFQLSGIVYYRSAYPWTAFYLQDVNKDGLARDYVDSYRNARRGFDCFFINTRLSKFIHINPVRMSLFLEMYNLNNRTNFAPEIFHFSATDSYNNPIQNRQGAPNFGAPTIAGDPRLIQFGVRLDF